MQALKQEKIWICWRYEDVNGRRTKVPYAANGRKTGTNAEYANNRVTYDEAVKAAEELGATGVGFVIPEGGFFLDVDHKELSDPLVQMLLDRFGSYTERSVSGTGLHIYGKCDLSKLPTITDKDGKTRLDKQYYMKNPHNGLELYIGGLTNRFAAYTGDRVLDEPMQDCTAAILATLDKNMRKKEKAQYSEDRDEDRESFDIVCNLRKQKNGDKFKRLYDEGDYTGYNSQSEADAALCAMVAFRTGPDPAAIDAIFRDSALYRDKWERGDYRQWTIDAGIEACHGVFHRSVMPHPEFIKFDPRTKEPYVSPPLLAKYIRENLHYVLVRDNARQGILIYVYERGCYRLYAPEMLKGVIKSYIASYNEELVSMGKVTEVFNQLITDLNYVSQDALNADEDLINFNNGLLRVTATETILLPHSPDVISTIQIPCNWTGKPSPTPVFDVYMDTLTGGDEPIQNLLLEYDGACISNIKGWRMKKALFMEGPGDTGKSQKKSLVERLVGKGNFVGIDLKDIEARFGTGAIYGMRLAGSSDMSFLSVDELKTFKKITSGDSLFAEFKGQQAFEFTYNGLLWFCMNRLPKFGGDDGKWVYDRIMVIECKNVIPKDKQDKCLLDKMYAEREGIVYKAIMALKTVIANGYRFSEPESVTQARDTYMTENNTVITFYNECMTGWPDSKIKGGCTTGKVYDVYKAWCGDNNNGYAKTAKDFRLTLAGHLGTAFKDMTVRRGDGGTFYKDFTLTREAMEQYRKAYGYDGSEFLS